MELNININTNDNCTITIVDKSTYLPESSSSINKLFKYSDTISITTIELNKTDEVLGKSVIYSEHNNPVDIQIPIKFDGWFTINYIVLPTKEWFDEQIKKEASQINVFDTVFYVDGTNIYKYTGSVSEPSSIEEVLRNTEENTTISKMSKEYVSICFLRKCYINLCYEIFNSRGFSRCSSTSKVDSELIYKRDLVWMTINVIKYLTQNATTPDKLFEIQRIIENIQGCNGLCTPTFKNSTYHGCNCNK